MPYCSKCGAQAREGDTFCRNCGAKLIRAPTQAPAAEKKAGKIPGATAQAAPTQAPAAEKKARKIPGAAAQAAPAKAPAAEGQPETVLAVKTAFFPLAFLLLLCKPTIVIDGKAYRKHWGTHSFEVDPGKHHIKIFFPYLFWPECGANSIDVTVEEGKTTRVKFYMPPLVLLKGSLKMDQATATAKVPQKLVTKQAAAPEEEAVSFASKKPLIAGILSIIAGVTGLLMGFAYAISIAPPLGGIAILGIIGIAGGVCAVKRTRWGLALAGAICSLLALPLGIAAIILVILSRGEFNLPPSSTLAAETPSQPTRPTREEQQPASEKAQAEKATPVTAARPRKTTMAEKATPVTAARPRKATLAEKAAPVTAARPRKATQAETVEIDGVPFPITSDTAEFCQIAATNRACVMPINTKDYARITQKAFGYFSDKFGRGSNFTMAVSSARLICSGCKWEFPGSYTLSLMDPAIFGGGKFIGATPGYQEFARTGRCPRCGSQQSFYIYDNLPGKEIARSDIDAIRQYWRHLAQQWWKTESRTEAICDRCTSPVARGDGYIDGSSLLCEKCCNKSLGTDALKQLRENPNYFGAGLVRKARHFVAVK